MAGMVAAEAAPLQVMSLRGVFYAAEAYSSRVGHIGLRGARYSREKIRHGVGGTRTASFCRFCP